MRKKIPALMLLIVMVFALPIEAEKTFDRAEITWVKNDVYLRRGGGSKWLPAGKYKGSGIRDNTFIKSGENSGFVVTFNNGSEIRCGADTRLHIKSNDPKNPVVRTAKGKSWFSINKKEGALASVETAGSLIETQGAVFSYIADGEIIEVYSGKIRKLTGVKPVYLSRGKRFVSGKIESFKPGHSSWEKRNYDRDRVKIGIAADISGWDNDKVKNLIKDNLKQYYFVGDVIFDKEILYGLKTKIKFSVQDKQATASGAVKFNGETYGIIDFTEKYEKTGKKELLALSKIVSQSAEVLGMAAKEYAFGKLKNGRKVIIEMEQPKDIYGENVTGIIKRMPGTVSIKKSRFYGQKTVLEVVYRGTAGNIAEIIHEKKFKNRVINVWKYTGNIVKLSFDRIQENKE